MDKITPKLISWASIMDDKTRLQAITAAQMPFIFPHIALMPDAHLGLGATVGSVIPTQHAIMPAAGKAFRAKAVFLGSDQVAKAKSKSIRVRPENTP